MYLSLNDDIIPNHGYVDISDIGSTDDTALICHTNRPTTLNINKHSGGDWVGPSGIVVGGATIGTTNVPGFMRNRDPMIVRLLRNTSTATDPLSEGIFHCEVEDNTGTQQTVYVGVYNSGRGMSTCIIHKTYMILYMYNHIVFRRHHNIWWCDVHSHL